MPGAAPSVSSSGISVERMSLARRMILLPVAALALSGCVAGMAASAVGMVAGGGQQRPHRNVELMLVTARQACTERASQYGAVEVTGLREADANEVIVSGTVAGKEGRSSFRCRFVTQITAFDLQPI